MQTTHDERIKAEIKLLQFVIDNMVLSPAIISRKVYFSVGGFYKAVLFVDDINYYQYNLGQDINQTISVLETIKEEWS